jgi:hypothetical protein
MLLVHDDVGTYTSTNPSTTASKTFFDISFPSFESTLPLTGFCLGESLKAVLGIL